MSSAGPLTYLQEETATRERNARGLLAIKHKATNGFTERVNLKTEKFGSLQHVVPCTASLGHVHETLFGNELEICVGLDTLKVIIVDIIKLPDNLSFNSSGRLDDTADTER